MTNPGCHGGKKADATSEKNSDAVSLRRHKQLSHQEDNCLLGQHHTKLSDSGDPQRREEGAAEVGGRDASSSASVSFSSFHSLHSGGKALGKPDA